MVQVEDFSGTRAGPTLSAAETPAPPATRTPPGATNASALEQVGLRYAFNVPAFATPPGRLRTAGQLSVIMSVAEPAAIVWGWISAPASAAVSLGFGARNAVPQLPRIESPQSTFQVAATFGFVTPPNKL